MSVDKLFVKAKYHMRSQARKTLRHVLSYLLIPIYLLSEVTGFIAESLQYVAPDSPAANMLLSFYNLVFGSLNDDNLLAYLLIMSMFLIMVLTLWERRPRSPFVSRRMIGEWLMRSSASLMIDWTFGSLIFFSASLDLLVTLATEPEWVATTVSAFSYAMIAASLLQGYVKKKMGITVRGPIEDVFDPEEMIRRMRGRSLPEEDRIGVPLILANR